MAGGFKHSMEYQEPYIAIASRCHLKIFLAPQIPQLPKETRSSKGYRISLAFLKYQHTLIKQSLICFNKTATIHASLDCN